MDRIESRNTNISADNLVGTLAAQLEILTVFEIHSATPGFVLWRSRNNFQCCLFEIYCESDLHWVQVVKSNPHCTCNTELWWSSVTTLQMCGVLGQHCITFQVVCWAYIFVNNVNHSLAFSDKFVVITLQFNWTLTHCVQAIPSLMILK
jgi:hypothetical protein